MTGMDIPTGRLYFQNLPPPHANLFHAFIQGQSMGDLKVPVSKGKTVATLLDTKFPPLGSEGDRPDELISFKTMAYV